MLIEETILWLEVLRDFPPARQRTLLRGLGIHGVTPVIVAALGQLLIADQRLGRETPDPP